MGREGEKLEFWRRFFRDLEHDLWTVIDRGIAIAAADYPDKLRERRDGIAERLFRGGSAAAAADGAEEEEEEAAEAAGLRGSVSRHSEISPAATVCDHVEYMDMGSGNRDNSDVGLVFKIKKELIDLDKNDDDIVELLGRLADLNLSIETLKVTEIGKPVNNLRKHKCDQVKSAAKKLIRSWKAVADEWAKSLDDVQGKDEECAPAPAPIDENELFANTFEMTQIMDLMDNNMATGCSIPTDDSPLNASSSRASHSPMRLSPFPNNSGDHFQSSRLKHAKKDDRRPLTMDGPDFRRRKEPPQQHMVSKREQNSFVNEKLAAAKRKLQEGYKRAETAKKNRTVQVMDLMDLPKGTGPKAVKRSNNTTNLPHRR